LTAPTHDRTTERVVVIDGELTTPGALLRLRGLLRTIEFVDDSPVVVVDLSAVTAMSTAASRLLVRTAKVMARRRRELRVLG
jgi:anti-anti-sigma regulatory factor